MKSTILISRIMRVVETDGLLGEGASLATAYGMAVRKVNARLESVQSAIDAGQISDAVRMMEDTPRLLDEINALDFIQLPDWEALCERQDWERPVSLDRALVERILELGKNTQTAEPFLRMYRKAVRLNDNALAVKALRRLVEVDSSQNWMEVLEKAERAFQQTYLDKFVSARARGDDEEMTRLAQELVETAWQYAPTGRGVDAVRAFLAERDARRRDVEGRENIGLLRTCHEGTWNRALASSMLRAIDALVEQGWTIPETENGMVDACRRRCADEQEAEERERRYNVACERLHAAVQREDTAEIREALALTEFLDREPPEDLLRDARRVIAHEEEAKRRKVLQTTFCVMAGIVAVLGISGWWLRQKLFNDRCEGEVAKLDALIAGPHAVDRVGEALRRLEQEAKDVYDDPRVNVYVGKLKTLAAANGARTNEIVGVLAALTAQNDLQWADADVSSITGRFARVEELLKSEDVAYSREVRRLKASWNRHRDEAAAATREKGTSLYEKTVAEVEEVIRLLRTEVGGASIDERAEGGRKKLAGWKNVYGTVLPEKASALTEVEKNLAEAEESQKNVRQAIDAIRNAKTATDMTAARAALLANYSAYAAVKPLMPHPVGVEDVKSVLDGTAQERRNFASVFDVNVDRSEKLSAIIEEVKGYEEIPALYSLVGLSTPGDVRFFALALGKPKIGKPDYVGEWVVDGEILDLEKREMVSQLLKRGEPRWRGLAPTEEVKELVDKVKMSDLSVGAFESFLLKKIEGHLSDVRKSSFVKNEKLFVRGNSLYVGHYPAWRRVWFLNTYFKWLKDLHLLPRDAKLEAQVQKLAELANPISVENVSPFLTWACLWDGRVKKRNEESAQALAEFPKDWLTQYTAGRSVRNVCQDILRLKVETAGGILFDPRNSALARNPKALIPIVQEGVERTHPLYVLRREGDELVLRKAFVAQEGAWCFVSEMKDACIPGEPLYQVCRNGKPIDAESEIEAMLKDVSPDIAKRIARKIPFFRGLARQK